MKRWHLVAIVLAIAAAFFVLLTGCRSAPDGDSAAAETAPPAPSAEVQEVDTGYTYTCPMHPEIQQDRPGKCPECGMFLQAETDHQVEYYCPMHEDVVQEGPGKCPECGMFLEAREAS